MVANAAIVPAGTGGAISAYANANTDLVLDINGYFASTGQNGLALYLSAPCRAYDSRNNHGQPFTGERTIGIVGNAARQCGGVCVQRDGRAQGALGYLTLWQDGQPQPTASTLNALDGAITSNMAIVPTTNGSIDAYAAGLTQLLLDISGYFAP